jgi:hypothetical protein
MQTNTDKKVTKWQNLYITFWQTALPILAVVYASLARADDFKTVNGKEYKNVTVRRVEPDGIVVGTKIGISKIYFNELPKEVQDRFHYDPGNAVRFTAAVQATVIGSNASSFPTSPLRKTKEENFETDTVRVALKYLSPEQLATDEHKAAQAKAFSAEEEKHALASIPPGGRCVVRLYARTIGYGDPEYLTYVILSGTGEAIERKRGTSSVPSKHTYGYWWAAYDVFDLPTFQDSLRLRIYDELLAQTLGEYVFRRNQQPERVCCEQFLPPD